MKCPSNYLCETPPILSDTRMADRRSFRASSGHGFNRAEGESGRTALAAEVIAAGMYRSEGKTTPGAKAQVNGAMLRHDRSRALTAWR